MAMPDPSAWSAIDAIKVAGGQIARSTLLRKEATKPSWISVRTEAEALRPFIFQLPATSGRGRSTLIGHSCRQVRDGLADAWGVFQHVLPFSPRLRSAIGLYNEFPRNGFQMLRGMRLAGQSLVGKIIATVLFGFLILSFAVWGIGDIFRTTPPSVVAQVGKTSISVDQMRIAYTNELQRLGRQFRTVITPEQART